MGRIDGTRRYCVLQRRIEFNLCVRKETVEFSVSAIVDKSQEKMLFRMSMFHQLSGDL